MSDIVIDSCVAAKWFLPEADREKALKLLEQAATGDKLISLDIAFAEVANAIWNRRRRRLLKEADADNAIDDLFKTPVSIVKSTSLTKRAYHIAVKYDRSVYDAMFVALAESLDTQGITADEKLYNAVHADFPKIVLLRNLP
jgi:predicted nucleic acid-binding protein